MWRTLSSIACFGHKKSTSELSTCQYFSDDETSSNSSTDEGLECPICCESFNIVENVPYILWCGHTLCKNCVLCLQCSTVKVSTQRVLIPFFVSCPWCNILSFRLVYKGNLRFPRKNFFLLWMVESRNGDRVKSLSSIHGDREQAGSPAFQDNYFNLIRRSTTHIGDPGSSSITSSGSSDSERANRSFQKSLDFFIHLTAKIPFVVLLLVFVFALPISAVILTLYVAITFVFALPAFLVIYFAFPALKWLGREIRA